MNLEKIFSVSEFNEYIKLYLSQVGEVVIEGELSQLKINQGKWVFGTIKDEGASVDIFGTVFQLSNVKQLEEGMKVRVYGVPSLYEKTGRFSVFVSQIIPAGEGALKIAFEKLKIQLEQEGLFDVDRKRKLPEFPQQIGLITAKGSQAYNDFVKILSARMGGITIKFFPAIVQGDQSPGSIVEAVKFFNTHFPTLDLIVITRGGGSLEDLIGFNDERVVRAIFASKIAVVCAVGHEGDWSLADLVSDLRASTPSNAAELIVKDRRELIKEIDYQVERVQGLLNQSLLAKKNNLDQVVSAIEIKLKTALNAWQLQLVRFEQVQDLFRRQIKKLNEVLVASQKGFEQQITRQIQSANDRLTYLSRILNSLDYQQVLKRGFSVTRARDGRIIKDVHQLDVGSVTETTFLVGAIMAEVKEIKK